MPMPAVFNVALNSSDTLRNWSACARLAASLARSASSVSARSLRVLLRRSSMLIAPCNVPPSQYCPQLTQKGLWEQEDPGSTGHGIRENPDDRLAGTPASQASSSLP